MVHSRSPLFQGLQASPAATAPLIVPMELTISHVRIRTIFVLILSKARGLTLSFKTDPLESIQVSSTFDGIVESVKAFLQREIEEKLRGILRDELPTLLHLWSLDWLQKTGAEDPYSSMLLEDFKIPRRPSQPNPSGSLIYRHTTGSISSSLLPTRADSPRELKKSQSSLSDSLEQEDGIGDLHYFARPHIVHRASSGAAVIDAIDAAQDEMKEWRQKGRLPSVLLKYLPSGLQSSNDTRMSKDRQKSMSGSGGGLYDEHIFESKTGIARRGRTSSWIGSGSQSVLGSGSFSVYDPEEFRSEVAWTSSHAEGSQLMRSGSLCNEQLVKNTGIHRTSHTSTTSLATRLSLLRSVNITSSPYSSSTLQSNHLIIGRYSRRPSDSKNTQS